MIALILLNSECLRMRDSEPVNRLMTEEVLSLDVNAPAGEILRYFAEYPVHHLPVVEGNRVVGMLSSADVLKLEAFLPKGADRTGFLSRRVQIEHIMRKPAITVGPHASVEHAASIMAQRGIHALPVVNEYGNLLGIITTTDIIQYALRSASHASGQVEPEARVSSAQREEALAIARNRARDETEMGRLSRAFLHVESRARSLESVLASADRYIRAGQDERLHTQLLRAVERARELSDSPEHALSL